MTSPTVFSTQRCPSVIIENTRRCHSQRLFDKFALVISIREEVTNFLDASEVVNIENYTLF
jgi:hypothetical protein